MRRMSVKSGSLAAALGLTLFGPACAPASYVLITPPCVQERPALAPEPCKGQLSTAPEGFQPIDAPELIAQAKKGPGEGGACDARAYQVSGTRAIYRAYNGTHPQSKLGAWWALEEPSGSVSAYRRNYEICYQWSPLDRLVKCTLRAGAKVVLGTGQSVVCSEHLTYSTSASLQLYVADAKQDALDCTDFDGMLSWQPAPTETETGAESGAETASAGDGSVDDIGPGQIHVPHPR